MSFYPFWEKAETTAAKKVSKSIYMEKKLLDFGFNCPCAHVLCINSKNFYKLSLVVVHTILISIKSVWEDDVCFVNPTLCDRFWGSTHYQGNDGHVFDKQDQQLPTDTSAFIFSLKTQRSLKGNNTWDKYLVFESKPGISPGTADEGPLTVMAAAFRCN